MGTSPSKNQSSQSVFKKNSDSNIRANLLDSATILKKYDPLSFFVKDAFIDALDVNNEWRVAKIYEINGENLSIFFDGWSKWNEV